jgi:hypothetical protein
VQVSQEWIWLVRVPFSLRWDLEYTCMYPAAVAQEPRPYAQIFSAAVQLFFYGSPLDPIFLWTRNSALSQMPRRSCEDCTQLLNRCSHAHVQGTLT